MLVGSSGKKAVSQGNGKRRMSWMDPLRLMLGMSVMLAISSEVRAAASSDRVSCHDGGGFRVIQKNRTDSVGADFLIRRTTGPVVAKPCAFLVEPGDLRLPGSHKTENAWDFLALSGDRLALDEGTASQNRTLVVVDLPTSRVVGRFETFETARVVADTAYITIPGRRGTRTLCPGMSKEQLSNARMISETAIDLATLMTIPGHEAHCVYEE